MSLDLERQVIAAVAAGRCLEAGDQSIGMRIDAQIDVSSCPLQAELHDEAASHDGGPG